MSEQNAGEWIKCSERMPETSRNVVIYVAGVVTTGFYHLNRWFGPSGFSLASEVSHWMPLHEWDNEDDEDEDDDKKGEKA